MNLLLDQKLQVSQKTPIFPNFKDKGSSLQKEKVEKFGELRLMLLMMMKTHEAHVLCPLERT